MLGALCLTSGPLHVHGGLTFPNDMHSDSTPPLHLPLSSPSPLPDVMTSANSPGYCLWLVPPPDQSKSLSSLISTLSHSATNLTGVKSPTFQPHVTLFSPRSDVRADVDEMKRRTQRALEIYSKGEFLTPLDPL